MQEPFDIFIGATPYSVFPEEDNTFTIFKDGKEYTHIQKDTEGVWLRLDYETDLPLFDEDAEINEIGRQINLYLAGL
ncbi:hypothetical protein [Daejeonella sp.]|uniref:hypothetical protein n=1 Tax=Daejeonella sp. TaxID=2805397 RepID=UPI0039836277